MGGCEIHHPDAAVLGPGDVVVRLRADESGGIGAGAAVEDVAAVAAAPQVVAAAARQGDVSAGAVLGGADAVAGPGVVAAAAMQTVVAARHDVPLPPFCASGRVAW